MAVDLLLDIDDALLDAYRAAAKRNGRSIETELRDALERTRPILPPKPKRHEEMGELSRRLRAINRVDFDPTSAEVQIRQDRDRSGDA